MVTLASLQDYLIAEGSNGSYLYNNAVVSNNKFCFSQDGIKWVDLESVESVTAAKALSFNTQLSGEPAKTYGFQEPIPEQPAVQLEEVQKNLYHSKLKSPLCGVHRLPFSENEKRYW